MFSPGRNVVTNAGCMPAKIFWKHRKDKAASHTGEAVKSLTFAAFYMLTNATSFQPQVIIYTDGSSRGNPGPGGYGVVMMAGNLFKELSEGFRLTTNNRMELLAVIKGLEALRKPNTKVVVYSDSKYVVDAVEKGWLQGWLRTQFKGGKKNPDLWMRFHQIYKTHQVKLQWVKGHADNPFNNRCDELATTAADGKNLLTDEWFEQHQAS